MTLPYLVLAWLSGIRLQAARHVLGPDDYDEDNGSSESAYSETDYHVSESQEESEDEYDSSYDHEIPRESLWPPLSELDDDHGDVYLSPQDKRELADYYENRARRRGQRVGRDYNLPGRQRDPRHGPEPARLDHLGGRGGQYSRARGMPDLWCDWEELARLDRDGPY